jgi:hypothetical protein
VIGCLGALGLLVMFWVLGAALAEAGYVFFLFLIFAGFGLWSLSPPVRPIFTPVARVGLYLAIGMLPHVVFLVFYNWAFDTLRDYSGIDFFVFRRTDAPPELGPALELYEQAVGTLHAWMKPFEIGAWIVLAGLIAVTLLIPSVPAKYLRGYMRYKEALSTTSIVLLGAASFTVFSGLQQGHWVASAQARFEAQLRREGQARAALVLVQAMAADLKQGKGAPERLHEVTHGLRSAVQGLSESDVFSMESTYKIAAAAQRVANGAGVAYGKRIAAAARPANDTPRTDTGPSPRLSLAQAWRVARNVSTEQQEADSAQRILYAAVASLVADVIGDEIGENITRFAASVIGVHDLVSEFWLGVVSEIASQVTEALSERLGTREVVQQLRTKMFAVEPLRLIASQITDANSGPKKADDVAARIVSDMSRRLAGDELSKIQRAREIKLKEIERRAVP